MGALVAAAPPSYHETGEWSPEALLDELPETGWASPAGDLTPKVFIFELAEKSTISSLGFDSAHTESSARAAKELKVEIADTQDGAYSVIATTTLAAMKDHQHFPLKTPASGRYLRLTVLSNFGDDKYMELMSIYAYGKPLEHRPLPDNSGEFKTSYGQFHLQQTGPTANGCYEWEDGRVENGGFEGRVLRFTWTQASGDNKERHGGPAMMIFNDDGNGFTGYWWNDGDKGAPQGRWVGERTAKEVGSCPDWKPGTDNAVVDQLQTEGRARLYGILFDTNSDHLKDESKTTLDELVSAAKSQAKWSFVIEGHTDNVGGDAHNQTLSEKRAVAVKAYLAAAGVDAARLTTQGFGATKPVATNDTELGRSQNRRVEVVKK
jgi:OOP family OmpA-OmpF porin